MNTEKIDIITSLANGLVGIIIVVHNRRDDLIRLLQSLLRQEYRAFEILIIDNGSTDDFSEIQDIPSVEYMRLEDNIGFVSGMINGLSYLLSKNKYKFLWILDSDVEVSPSALSRLVAVYKEHGDIGLAGCVIYNAYDREVVVETGADVDLRSGIVTPRFCNEKRPLMDKIVDVDYVGSGGGSLISVEALRLTGLHDERYYFLWEDIDFGLCMRRCGLRVVVVTDAIIWHPPFTEKRNPNIYAYYGVRNPLLTVAKYLNGLTLTIFLYFNLSRYLRIGLLMIFSGCNGFARLTFKAIFDFISGRFGKADLIEIEQDLPPCGEVDLSAENRIFIVGTGGRDATEAAVSAVRAATSAEIVLVVQCYRQTLLEGISVDSIITYDDHSSRAIREYLKVGMTILRQEGCIINTDLKVASPLSYFSSRVYDWDFSKGCLYRSRLNIFSAWKPAASIILGNVLALIILPLVWIASLKHKMKQPVLP